MALRQQRLHRRHEGGIVLGVETGDTSDWKNSQAWTQNGNWTKVGEFNFEKGISICRGPFCYLFPETQARYIRILITESNNKNTVRDCAQIAEIYALR